MNVLIPIFWTPIVLKTHRNCPNCVFLVAVSLTKLHRALNLAGLQGASRAISPMIPPGHLKWYN